MAEQLFWTETPTELCRTYFYPSPHSEHQLYGVPFDQIRRWAGTKYGTHYLENDRGDQYMIRPGWFYVKFEGLSWSQILQGSQSPRSAPALPAPLSADAPIQDSPQQ